MCRECEAPVYQRGLCVAHYFRQRRSMQRQQRQAERESGQAWAESWEAVLVDVLRLPSVRKKVRAALAGRTGPERVTVTLAVGDLVGEPMGRERRYDAERKGVRQTRAKWRAQDYADKVDDGTPRFTVQPEPVCDGCGCLVGHTAGCPRLERA